MAFDPNNYVSSDDPTATQNQQTSAVAPTPGFDPDQYLSQTPMHPSEMPAASPTYSPPSYGTSAGDIAMGGLNVAKDFAVNHPGITAAAGAAAFPNVASKIPVVGGAIDLAKGAIDVAKGYNLNQAEHQAVQYMKAGVTPPPEFTARLNQLRQAATSSVTEKPSFIQQGMEYANKVRQIALNKVLQNAPGVAEAAGNFGRAVAPALSTVGRVASAVNPYVTGAQLATYSKPLGPAVPSTGPMRGSEINPSTGRGWTPQELQQYSQQYR